MKRKKKSPHPVGTREQRIKAFLAAYRKCGQIKTAARAVPCAPCSHWNWLAEVPGYRELFAEVHAEVVERLGPVAESELVSRAIHGTETLVIFEGQPVTVWVNEDGEFCTPPADPNNPGNLRRVLYREVKKSDGLLQVLLKRLYPEKYADKQKIDHTSGGQPIQLAPIRLDGDKSL